MKQNKQEQWEKSTEYMLAKANINALMGNIIDTCFSRWNQKEMLIAQKIEDLVSGYVLEEMMKIYNANKFYKNLISQTRQEAVEEVKQKCKKIYIDEVDWSEWGISDEEAGEKFDTEYEELSQEKK